MGRQKKIGSQPSAISVRQFYILRANRCQVDGQIGPPVENALERLAQACGIGALVGHLVMLTRMDHRLLAGNSADNGDISRVLPKGLP